jgi:alpha-tubulin suppressor-like RCC1 family protein
LSLILCMATVRGLFKSDDPYQIYSTGRNEHGQLGVGDLLVRPKPAIVRGIFRPILSASSAQHALTSTVDGLVYGWGEETQGQLTLIPENGIPVEKGSSHSFNVLQPTLLSLLVADKIKVVSTGREHTVTCTWSGDVISFGRSSRNPIEYFPNIFAEAVRAGTTKANWARATPARRKRPLG